MANYKTKAKNESVTLTSQHYLTEGGEGQIFVKNGIAYKIYFQGKEPPEGKLQELQRIKNENVIVPTDILLDSKTNNYVGNSMPFLDNSEYFSLAQVIPNAFWQRNNISHNSISCLIEHFKNTLKDIHKANTLLVDINEFNFLVDKAVKEIFCIDTNSYQTENYPATAIMEANRDWQHKNFTTLTDWFSFGILTFYVYTGIHPFRGGSTNLTGSLDEVTKERILKNISVLNSKVKYPKRAVRDFSLIPKNWYDWYYNEFEKGLRNPPPDNFNQVLPATVKKYDISSDCLILTLIKEFEQEIIQLDKIGGQKLVLTKDYVFLDNSKYNRKDAEKFIVRDNRLMPVKINNNRLFVDNAESQFECSDFFISNNSVYGKCSDKICRIDFLGSKMIQSAVSEISSLTGKCYGYQDGFALQNLAGETYLILVDSNSSYQIKIPQLIKHSVINAEKSGDYIIGYSRRNNEYYHFQLKLKDFALENCEIVKVNGISDIRFIQHKSGSLISLFADTLVLSSGNKNRIIKDKFFTNNSNIQFVEVNGEMYFSNGKNLFKGKLK